MKRSTLGMLVAGALVATLGVGTLGPALAQGTFESRPVVATGRELPLTLEQTPVSSPTAVPPPTAGHQPPVTHEQMHQMMDAMHRPGASQRMHEAMGPEAEPMMDAMMGMMQGMGSMMGSGMPGMGPTMGGGMQGGAKAEEGMPGMRDRMMGR